MAAPDSAHPLAGVRVLVTRPRDQAEPLAQGIALAGGKPVRFPAIEIAALHDTAALDSLIARLAEFNLAIFISSNAVEHGLTRVLRALGHWPEGTRIAAVGAATARALAGHGIGPIIAPDKRYDSEALLALPALTSVRGQRIVIFRGEDGRELLADSLRTRGATVEYASCYRRIAPREDAAWLRTRVLQGEIDVVTLTSVEALHNLHAALGSAGERLLAVPAVVASERIARTWRELGAHGPVSVAKVANDEALIEALIETCRSRQNPL